MDIFNFKPLSKYIQNDYNEYPLSKYIKKRAIYQKNNKFELNILKEGENGIA